MHVKLDHMSKLDLKSKKCIFIGYEISEYDYHFWDPENRKILRHKNAIFSEMMVYKNFLTERSTPDQQSSNIDLKFIELDDVPIKKIRSIPEENEESRVEPPTPKLR